MSLIVHKSISDLYKALNIPIEQEMDFTIHSLTEIHPVIPFKSPVFRADYFSFVFIKSGKGLYTIDDKQYPTVSNTIYFTNPGHIKAFEMEELDAAYIITLTETFLREHIHTDIFEEFPFLLSEVVPPKVLPPAEFEEFESLYMQILREFHGASAYKDKILGNLFIVLLLKIKEKFYHDYDPMQEGDRNSQIVKSFRVLLEEQFVQILDAEVDYLYQVQDYAREMNLHPNYLGHVIKSKTGKTVHHWIAEQMVSATKTLLRNTSLSSKEISFRLGFSEPTHFSRFFKKQMGITPSAYRKTLA